MDAPPALRALAAGASLALAAACSSPVPAADLGPLYERTARAHRPDQNPVVLVPGLLGSNLAQVGSGRVVWGAFRGDYAHPAKAEGARLVALPMERGKALSALRDDVAQKGALDTLRLSPFGLPGGVSAYVNLLLALGIGGYREEALGLSGAVDYGDEPFTCFQFAYDWRRDLSESARELHAFLVDREAYVLAERAARGAPAPEGAAGRVRFDVVAHGMGGLVVRYYLRYGPRPLPDDGSLPELTWEGADRIERAILVGPPNAGTGQAFVDLLDGRLQGRFVPAYEPALLGTMPSIYQLLPRARHGFWVRDAEGEPLAADPLDPELWARREWGLADPSQEEVLEMLLPAVGDPAERRRVALDHQAKCLRRASQFFEAMDAPASPPPGTELHLYAGDSTETLAAVRVGELEGDLEMLAWEPGDGVVPRTSALLDERAGGEWRAGLRSPIDWTRVTFLFEGDLGLTRSPAFIDNLLYTLLEEPR